MRRTLLDTDIFSEVLKGKSASVAEAAQTCLTHFDRLKISAITVMEIVQGLEGKAIRAQFMRFVEEAEVLDLDRHAAEIAGRMFFDLKRSGQPIGRADPMIAAIAMHHDIVLATANTSHFQRVVALGYPIELQNWREYNPHR